MSLSLYVEYSDNAYLQFYCRHCANDSCRNFDFPSSLTRIASKVPDLSTMRCQSECEPKFNLLLMFFQFSCKITVYFCYLITFCIYERLLQDILLPVHTFPFTILKFYLILIYFFWRCRHRQLTSAYSMIALSMRSSYAVIMLW